MAAWSKVLTYRAEVAWQESTALESSRQISILTGSVRVGLVSCVPLCERRTVHGRGDTHWHPTHFGTSAVSCVISRLIKVLVDELASPDIFIVLPALTHSNNFQGTLLFSTIYYCTDDIETSIEQTTAYSPDFNTAKYRSDLVDTTNTNHSES